MIAFDSVFHEIAALRNNGFSGPMAFTAHPRRDAEILQESGAALILTPFAHAAREAAEILIEETCIEESCSKNQEGESSAGEIGRESSLGKTGPKP